MVVVASPNRPFTYNTKGYPRRKWVLQDYQKDIDAAYIAVEESAQSDVTEPAVWDTHSTREFLHTVVEKVLHKSIPDDADFFRSGCDRYVSLLRGS